MPAGDTTYVHYNFVVAKPLVQFKARGPRSNLIKPLTPAAGYITWLRLKIKRVDKFQGYKLPGCKMIFASSLKGSKLFFSDIYTNTPQHTNKSLNYSLINLFSKGSICNVTLTHFFLFLIQLKGFLANKIKTFPKLNFWFGCFQQCKIIKALSWLYFARLY